MNVLIRKNNLIAINKIRIFYYYYSIDVSNFIISINIYVSRIILNERYVCFIIKNDEYFNFRQKSIIIIKRR
jgi:hypothetical protein